MKHELEVKPKSPKIIVGFPGYGLVGTIVTEFLIKHLEAKQIGRIVVHEAHPIVAIHDRKVVDPVGIFYDKKYNLVIVHALTSINGLEWRLAEEVVHIFKTLKAKEIISIEGVGNPALVKDGAVFYFSDNDKKFQSIGIKELKEGIIMGVTGALLLKKGINLSCVFAETHSQLPDSRAAALAVEVLDKYLGLKVDYKPLLKEAQLFETKLREVMDKARSAMPKQTEEEKKQAYFG